MSNGTQRTAETKTAEIAVPYKLFWAPRAPGYQGRGTEIPGRGEAGYTVARFATVEAAAEFARSIGAACLMPNQHPAVRAAVA